MKHLGDISKINGAEIEPVDIVTFGSPCQDLSCAGKRAGMKHTQNGDEETTRSGLFMEAVRIIKEMREATDGKYPRYALWENVPGAFSSNKGEDFRVVLEELIKIAEPEAAMPAVPPFGWAYADSYVGDRWSLAYRVFDTQYWPRTPQRRRRIYLVADFGGQCAREILFEREGLRRNLAPGRTPWQTAAGDAERGIGADDREVIYAVDQGGGKSSANVSENLSPTLTCTHGGEPAVAYSIDHPLELISVATQQGGAEISENGICPTVTASAGMSGNNQPWVVYNGENIIHPLNKANPHCGSYEAETRRKSDLNGGRPACNQGGVAVIEKTGIIDNIGGQAEYGRESLVNGTLRAGAQGAVVYEWHNQDSRIQGPVDVAYTLNTNAGGREGHLVMETARHSSDAIKLQQEPAYSIETFHCSTEVEKVQTLKARDWKDPHVVAYGVDCRNINEYPDLYPTLQTKPNGGQSLNFSGAVRERYIIRRLTPTECARLQGFPDAWGHPDKKERLGDDEYEFWQEVRNTHASINGKVVKNYTKAQMEKWYDKLHSDSAEYKMWGNGIALPTALYVMQGIADVLQEGAHK